MAPELLLKGRTVPFTGPWKAVLPPLGGSQRGTWLLCFQLFPRWGGGKRRECRLSKPGNMSALNPNREYLHQSPIPPMPSDEFVQLNRSEISPWLHLGMRLEAEESITLHFLPDNCKVTSGIVSCHVENNALAAGMCVSALQGEHCLACQCVCVHKY